MTAPVAISISSLILITVCTIVVAKIAWWVVGRSRNEHCRRCGRPVHGWNVLCGDCRRWLRMRRNGDG